MANIVGKVVQVIGPVIDIKFSTDTLPNIFNSTVKHLKSIFSNVFILGYYIRSYGTYNYFAICTDQKVSFDLFKSTSPDQKIKTKFYNLKMKNSCLTLPPQIILQKDF